MNINKVEKPTFDITLSVTQEEIDALSHYMNNYIDEEEDDEDDRLDGSLTQVQVGGKLFDQLRSTLWQFKTQTKSFSSGRV